MTGKNDGRFTFRRSCRPWASRRVALKEFPMSTREALAVYLSHFTDAQKALLPTDEEVALYRETGWYKSRKLFTDEEIDAALAASEAFYAGETGDEFGVRERLRSVTGRSFVPVPGMDYGAKLRKHDYASRLAPGLAALVHHPLLGAVAARLAGDDVRLWHDQLLYKPRQVGDMKANVGWHTDRGYWKTCTSTNLLTAWIPFHDCDATMGTITMIDGSLHWPDNTAELNFFSNDLDGLERKFDTGGKPVVKVPVNLQKGEVSFHHCLTIHGSGPNLSDRPRRSIAVHMQDAANRYQHCQYPDGRVGHHDLDDLVRTTPGGAPDYSDPDFNPLLGVRL